MAVAKRAGDKLPSLRLRANAEMTSVAARGHTNTTGSSRSHERQRALSRSLQTKGTMADESQNLTAAGARPRVRPALPLQGQTDLFPKGGEGSFRYPGGLNLCVP